MEIIIILISIALLSIYIGYYSKLRRRNKSSLINRFRKKFKSKDHIKHKLIIELSYSLMADPEKDIKISTWNTESERWEKADIHRARLNKYGRSKMNGEMFFMGSKGEVYKYSDKQGKVYI